MVHRKEMLGAPDGFQLTCVPRPPVYNREHELNRMKQAVALAAIAATLAAQTGNQPSAPEPIRGFPESQWAAQHALEQKAQALPEPDRIRGYLQRMSEVPHHAGSAGSLAVAEYALGLLKEWGLDARIEEFEAMLPYPTARTLELVSPVKYRAALKEPAIAGDAFTSQAGQLPHSTPIPPRATSPRLWST